MIRPLVSAGALALATLIASSAMSQSAPSALPVATAAEEEPYRWLEEIEGNRARVWVEARNAHSLGVLQGDPRYQSLHDQALAIVSAQDRIPAPGFTRGMIDNFWQDDQHVRGIWRRTTLDSYRTEAPQWETILDFDALAEAEGANWVYKGAGCLAPEERHCLIYLSDGGKDAVTVREFDSVERRFVEDGFVLPESKGGATWIDRDTLLVSRDFGEGTLTTSGYPMTIRRLERGGDLATAPEIFRGEPTDVSVSAYTLREPDGALAAVLINRGRTFYEGETHMLRDDGTTVRLPLPDRSSVQSYVGGRLVFTTEQDWTDPSGRAFASGDLLAYDLAALKTAPESATAQLVLRPGPRDAIEGVTSTRNELVVALFENVRGAVYVLTPEGAGADGWSRRRLDLPQNVTVGLGSASELDDRLFVSVAGYLTPSSLWLVDAASGEAAQVKSMPEK